MAILFLFVLLPGARSQFIERERPAEWEGLVFGGRFMDRFLPVPPVGELTADTWGADAVRPRYVDNGIEDEEWSYWGGNALRGKDGKYHLFVCRWREDSPKGHMQWPQSLVVHAVADHPQGPYQAKETIGPGHNPEIFRLKDGRYVIYVIDGRYVADDLNGPWTYGKFEFDPRDRPVIEGLSNLSFAQREDGSFIMVCRGGGIWFSKDGISPYYQVSQKSVYPPVDGRFEDPVLWRTGSQYHLIVNDWYGRIAYYLRSSNGIDWKADAGEAYLPGIARYTDGVREDWFKYERIKVLQDSLGRPTQAFFAVIDTLKKEDRPSDNHSSKNITIPLVTGRQIDILNKEKITAGTKAIRLRIKAEKGFDPHRDIDLRSLRFGAPQEVDFGGGSKVKSSRREGKDLIVTFRGKNNGLSDSSFMAKLLGRTSDGTLLFGYARLPGVDYLQPILSARAPRITVEEDKKISLTVEVQNFGQAVSEKSSVEVSIFRNGTRLGSFKMPLRELEPFQKEVLKTTGNLDLKKGGTYETEVIISPRTSGASVFSTEVQATSAPVQPGAEHNLAFDTLAGRWDEAMPLGNGMLGALVWKKDGRLRLSLDRADLWDERKALDLSKFNFEWVEEQVLKGDYAPVQKLGDAPYDQIPYPTKLPAAAMEFDISALGKVVSNVLDIRTALNTVKFESGAVFNCYIHATEPQGYFSFENLPSPAGHTTGATAGDASGTAAATGARNASGRPPGIASGLPLLIVHNYNSGKSAAGNDNSHAGQGLEKLGYDKGAVTRSENTIRYRQPTYDGRYYEVLIKWKESSPGKITGAWTVSNNRPAALPDFDTTAAEPTRWDTHIQWWKNFWTKSSVSLPDKLIEKQYYLELYKLGSVARTGAPAITLQAVWTADNGSLPPWKGDFHNDLNTQLSYWPAYTGNRLAAAATFTDWLWKIKPKNHAYTRRYFGVEGLNVPGVATLSGDPMGGWIQYSLSPTVSAWCAQHFYWQWKYSMDRQFLMNRAYPYLRDAATYLENITRFENGIRKLPLSSSPEYNNNSIDAWFLEWSNFDLSLAKFLFTAAAEVSRAAGKPGEAQHWQELLAQLPPYEVNETGFTVAPGQNLNESHRHMSQYMAIYPLALLDVNQPADRTIIENSLNRLEEIGTRAWCGYSFAWMASLYARAYKADSAAKQLRIFASNFCSPNSFHLNGDQKGGQYSDFTYRPFTLEGNFAFAQGVHELLLQSRNGYIEVFPAVPESWQHVAFNTLRAQGALLVSAEKENGTTISVTIKAEKSGPVKIKLPFRNFRFAGNAKQHAMEDGLLAFVLKAGEEVTILNES